MTKSEIKKLVKILECYPCDHSKNESLGNHLRNLLSPVELVFDIVSELDPSIDERLRYAQQTIKEGSMDRLIKFSKSEKMEDITWR